MERRDPLDLPTAHLPQHLAGHRISFSYRYLRRVGRFFEAFNFARRRFSDFSGEFNRVNQISTALRISLTDRWALTYRGGYSFENGILLANRGGFEYFSGCGCWSIGLEIAQDRVRGVDVFVSYSLKGFGTDAVKRAAERRQRDGLGFPNGLDAP